MIHGDTVVMLILTVIIILLQEIRLESMEKKHLEQLKLFKSGSLQEYNAVERPTPKTSNHVRESIRKGYRGWGQNDGTDEEPD